MDLLLLDVRLCISLLTIAIPLGNAIGSCRSIDSLAKLVEVVGPSLLSDAVRGESVVSGIRSASVFDSSDNHLVVGAIERNRESKLANEDLLVGAVLERFP